MLDELDSSRLLLPELEMTIQRSGEDEVGSRERGELESVLQS